MNASPMSVPEPRLIAGLLACCAGLTTPPGRAEVTTGKSGAKDYALTEYGGRLTDGDWHESFGPGTN